MACDSPKQAWDKLKEEFMGSDKTRQQQVINLRREFENLKMKESKTIKQYSDRIMATVNNIRLLGEDFSDSRVVEKVITTLPERFESKISLLEDSRDLTTISLSELVNSLYALEQRRATRQEESPEGAFQAKVREGSSSSQKAKKPWFEKRERSKKDVGRRRFPPCVHCKKTNHLEKYCWNKPDIQCKSCKQYGHHEKICRNQEKSQTLPVQAKTAEGLQAQEEHVFTASCSTTTSKSKCSWLVDGGCSHHMASDESLFKDLDRSFASKVRIGNGNLIEAKARGDVVINTVRRSCFTPMADRCFILDVSQLESRAYTSSVDNADLWHRRFGHVNFRSLNLLHKMSLIEDMIKVDANESV
ncbi:uncharacterized protein LOC128033810 [Gossypium raimondii]|uniref:uncharacterized protein LOC128033810 n=1 Tax=Gossypium raimondii TaxID=29730 RepID=UPI00227A5293|nr:uncharacterized protein LOC128033810 [Gossypium raimondii]